MSATLRLRWLFALLCALALTQLGCGDAPVAEDEYAIGWRPIDGVERFPERARIDYAMDRYLKDPASARMADPLSLPEFFGQKIESANLQNLRVERLRGAPAAERPIAFLWARFHDTDMYWNNRYKDVQLFRLVDATGGTHNPFPEASYARGEGAALVRMWVDYQPVSKGAPEGLHGEALLSEVARIAVWSYVSGNVDGPAQNGNNGGFARFRDASGRELWRGVLIDGGAAWNQPLSEQRPWNTNLLNTGPVELANISNGVLNSLTQIARASAEELAKMSKFDVSDEGAKNIVRGIRGRAQEVLDHYGVPWQ